MKKSTIIHWFVSMLVMMMFVACGGTDTKDSGTPKTPLTNVNQAPTANAGEDKLVTVNESITIIGSGSDSDGIIKSYQWKEGSRLLASTALLQYNPTTVGKHTLTLNVTDNNGAIGSDSIVVTVTGTGTGTGTNNNTTVCDAGYSLVYSFSFRHPSGSIASSSNKVNIDKSCFKNREVKRLEEVNLGTFKNKPNQYDMYYSNENRPSNGHSIYDYYSGTKYEGLSEAYYYASDTKVEMIAKVQKDIEAHSCKRYASNFSNGNLNRDDNFWTYFCPKENLISELQSILLTDDSNLTLKYTEQFTNFTPNGQDWTSGGSPLPQRVSVSDVEDGYAWDSNGDSWNHSGSYLNKFKLPWNKEFKVDFRLKQPIDSSSNYWLYLDLALSTEPFTGDDDYGKQEASIRVSGGDVNNLNIINEVSADINGDNKERRVEENYNDGKWHIYTIHHKINSAGAREIEILIDGKLFHQEINTEYVENKDFYIDINGRSYGLDNYLDYIKVYMEDNATIDTDQDGIPNTRETELGLNPDNNDSDGDGILDSVEIGDIANPTDTDNDGTIDALDLDSDDDGVSDADERVAGTNPLDANDYPSVEVNKSFDGIWEGNGRQSSGSTWTIKMTIESNTTNYKIDYPSLSCGGTLTLLSMSDERVEFNEKLTYGITKCIDNGKVVLVKSSEDKADFIWYYADGTEDARGVVERNLLLDTDQDGIPNTRETELGLNPDNNDSDGDGILDSVEIGDIANPTDTDNDGIIDALDLDSDDDGVSDADERVAGTNPLDANDYLSIDKTNILGKWRGTYTCGQGLTGLDLTIVSAQNSEVNATFSFYADASNPNVPSGSYSMLGVYRESDKLKLDTNQWINQPSGYAMVALDGTFDASFETYSGSVLSSRCSTFSLSKVADVNLSKGLVAHYEFEGNAQDSSGNGNDGVEHGGVAYSNGVIGQAGSFDGVDDYIILPRSEAIWEKGFSSCAWVQFEETDRFYERIFDIGNGENQDNIVFARRGTSDDITFHFNHPDYKLTTITDGIVNNDFQLYCATNDNTGLTKIYINGQNFLSEQLEPIRNIVRNSNFIAHSNWPQNDPNLYGKIDDLRIYNRALNEAEIAELYKMGESLTPVTTVKVSDFNHTIETSDTKLGTAYVHITSTIENEDSSAFYDNGVETALISGTARDGYVTLTEGQHKIKVCATLGTQMVCSVEKTIIVAKEIEETQYSSMALEGASNGISNDGQDIIYGTTGGNLYRLNLSTKTSTFIYDVNRRVSGLYVVDSDNYYYSSISTGGVYKVNVATSEEQTLTSVNFPDGLDVYNGKIYTVTNDASGILSIWGLDGTSQGTLNTSIDDIVGISHTARYLYILSESGEIYQTNPSTGSTQKVFTNDGLFDRSSSNNGLEGITILNNKIYVSYVNDEHIYLIDINLSQYE